MSLRSLFLLPALLGCAFGQGSTGSASITRDYSFPPTGLASTEIAQVNVVNIAQASSSANAVAPSCTGTVTFTSASGTAIKTNASATSAGVSFTTTGAQVFSTQLSFKDLAATGTRGEFVASVQLTTSVPSKAPCSLVFSLETFDSTSGATHIFLGNSAASANIGPITLPGF